MHIHDWILKIKNVSAKYPLDITKNDRQHNNNKDLYMLNRIEKDAEKKKSEVYSAHISENYHKENSNKDLLVRSSIGGGAEKQKSEIYFSTHFLGIIMNKDMIPSLLPSNVRKVEIRNLFP
jgi:hypothetical protein